MGRSTEVRYTTYDVRGHVVQIARRHVGTAYASNGNAHNPSLYFNYVSTLDGEHVTVAPTQWEAYEAAIRKAGLIGHQRMHWVIKDEMSRNRRRVSR